ncbi:hypothetical protein [Mycobacterium tilburgii]|uniref:hypothetical protein n=1 Tax=Mycobacterium tilburgii TaxID=44467 RepID=UPI0011837F37
MFADSDACVTPVLAFGEIQTEPPSATPFYEVNGGLQPRPAPHFSQTAPETPRPAAPVTDVADALND